MNISFLFILLGCQSSWDIVDVDGDGTTILDGDCWEQGDPPQIEGALEHTLTANDIGVGKYDAPYDGIDANCDGKNDFDVDGDGYVPDQFQGIATLNIEEKIYCGGIALMRFWCKKIMVIYGKDTSAKEPFCPLDWKKVF